MCEEFDGLLDEGLRRGELNINVACRWMPATGRMLRNGRIGELKVNGFIKK
jgi:hypothetical protein